MSCPATLRRAPSQPSPGPAAAGPARRGRARRHRGTQQRGDAMRGSWQRRSLRCGGTTHRKRRHLPRPRPWQVALALLGAVLVGCGAWPIMGDLRDQARYEGLAQDTGGIDWAALRAQNPDIAAWVTVEGTHVDYPVCVSPDGDASYYLTHDFWASESESGCPFIDPRCEADGTHVLVYGHHMDYTGSMFSDLFQCYMQESFDTLGPCAWSTPALGTTTLTPLCAVTVDKEDALLQRTEFASQAELAAWVGEVWDVAGGDEGARDDAWAPSLSRVRRVVTLVTCSSVFAGQRARTCVLFAA